MFVLLHPLTPLDKLPHLLPSMSATMFVLLHPLTLSVLATLFLSPFLYRIFRPCRSSKLPPGSLGWLPFLGDTLSFIAPHYSFSLGNFLDKNIKRYGRIFRAHVFGYPTVISCDAEFNSFILQNEERLFQSSYPKNIPGVLGDLTLLVSTGAVHKRLRGAALDLFAAMKTPDSSIIYDIEDIVLQHMESWKNKETLAFAEETRQFTISVIVKQILSLGKEDPETQDILDNFLTFMRGLISVPIDLPGTSYSKAIKARHRIHEILGNICQRREKEEREGKRRLDFLDALLHHDRLSMEEIFSLTLDLLLGGYETTSILIAMIVKFLSANPKMLSDLREEHLMVRRSKAGNEHLTWDDYRKMGFTQCLINEALRFGNVVKFVHRKTLKPIQFKGYHIPAGWKVLPVLSAPHLDPNVFSDPFRFDPSRWQNEDISSNARKFMPFGGGTRKCPGYELARLETCLLLHHFVLKYSWTPLIEDELPTSFPYVEFKHGFQIAIQPLGPS